MVMGLPLVLGIMTRAGEGDGNKALEAARQAGVTCARAPRGNTVVFASRLVSALLLTLLLSMGPACPPPPTRSLLVSLEVRVTVGEYG